ncbi:MAG: esterase [Planctomycetes bacterium]|nr:esterase [Planctomycetota bacterium]
MRKSIILTILIVLVATLLSTQPSDDDKYNKTLIKTITHNEMERSYRLYIPKSRENNDKLPLVIVLHGGGGTAEGTQNKLTKRKFDQLAETEQFIIVYPEGYKKGWNDGRESGQPAAEENIDDTEFISKIIDEVSKEHPINAKRIYATGISNGGFMSLRLACELSDKIAAAAPVTATMSEYLMENCKPAEPVSIMIINGTADPLVPYDGGEVELFGLKRGKVSSTSDSIKYWIKNNKCNETPASTKEIDNFPKDRTKVVIQTYLDDKNNNEVVLYKIEGGGHTWPGGWQYLSEKLIGITSKEIDACDEIINFFKKHNKS